MIEVCPGSEVKKAAKTHALHVRMLLLGAKRFIPLSGSSEDRSESRAYWIGYAGSLELPIQAIGCMVVIGGEHRRGRGRRYVTTRYPGRVVARWVNWRRAKRLARNEGRASA